MGKDNQVGRNDAAQAKALEMNTKAFLTKWAIITVLAIIAYLSHQAAKKVVKRTTPPIVYVAPKPKPREAIEPPREQPKRIDTVAKKPKPKAKQLVPQPKPEPIKIERRQETKLTKLKPQEWHYRDLRQMQTDYITDAIVKSSKHMAEQFTTLQPPGHWKGDVLHTKDHAIRFSNVTTADKVQALKDLKTGNLKIRKLKTDQ